MLTLRNITFGRVHWLLFFAGVLTGWVLLFAMAIPAEVRALEVTYGAALIEMTPRPALR